MVLQHIKSISWKYQMQNIWRKKVNSDSCGCLLQKFSLTLYCMVKLDFNTCNRQIYGEFAGLKVLFGIQLVPSHSRPFKIPKIRVNCVIIIPWKKQNRMNTFTCLLLHPTETQTLHTTWRPNTQRYITKKCFEISRPF